MRPVDGGSTQPVGYREEAQPKVQGSPEGAGGPDGPVAHRAEKASQKAGVGGVSSIFQPGGEAGGGLSKMLAEIAERLRAPVGEAQLEADPDLKAVVDSHRKIST